MGSKALLGKGNILQYFDLGKPYIGLISIPQDILKLYQIQTRTAKYS